MGSRTEAVVGDNTGVVTFLPTTSQVNSSVYEGALISIWDGSVKMERGFIRVKSDDVKVESESSRFWSKVDTSNDVSNTEYELVAI